MPSRLIPPLPSIPTYIYPKKASLSLVPQPPSQGPETRPGRCQQYGPSPSESAPIMGV